MIAFAFAREVPHDNMAKGVRLLNVEANSDAKMLMPHMFDKFANMGFPGIDAILVSFLVLECVLERFQVLELVLVLSFLVEDDQEAFKVTGTIEQESGDMPCATDLICTGRGRYWGSAERRGDGRSGARAPKPVNTARDVPDVTLEDRIPTVLG